MNKRDRHYDIEEEFHKKDRRKTRKERKLQQAKDRSKYKKTDLEKPKQPPPLGEFHRGRVLAILPEGIRIDCNHKQHICTLKGALKKERTHQKNLIVVGDYVHFDPTTYAIEYIEERYSILSRSDPLLKRKQHLIAANIDQVLIIVSVIIPPLKPFLVDRYIIAAKKGNMQPIIVVNKTDLLTNEKTEEKALFEQFLESYSKLHIPLFCVSAETSEGLEELRNALKGKTSVISGQSGVGKSSLLNSLFQMELPIGDVIERTRKGAHTTTRAELLPLPEDGFCIDTPGIKSFGVWDLKKEEVQNYFPDILAIKKDCKFQSCTHIHEPGCAVQKAVQEKYLAKLRYDSYCTLMSNPFPKEWE